MRDKTRRERGTRHQGTGKKKKAEDMEQETEKNEETDEMCTIPGLSSLLAAKVLIHPSVVQYKFCIVTKSEQNFYVFSRNQNSEFE